MQWLVCGTSVWSEEALDVWESFINGFIVFLVVMPPLQNESEGAKNALHVSRPARQCVEITAGRTELASTKCFFCTCILLKDSFSVLVPCTEPDPHLWLHMKVTSSLSFMPQVPWSHPASAVLPGECSPPPHFSANVCRGCADSLGLQHIWGALETFCFLPASG